MQICNDAFLCVRGGLGKGEDKLGAHAFCADHIDIFPVGLDGFLYNGKPEAGPFLIFSAGEVGFIKPLPDLVQGISWNADPVIFY